MSKPLVLRSSGLFGQLANGELINAGGTSNSTFSIGGLGALLEDGSNSKGSGPGLSLQLAYDSGDDSTIVLATGKHFTVSGVDEDPLLVVDGDTRKVSIHGDLEVFGDNITISTVIIDTDHWIISPASGGTIALHINPDYGLGSGAADLVRVRTYNNGPSVFTIDTDGEITATEDFTTNSDIHAGGTVFATDGVRVGSLVMGEFPGGDPESRYFGTFDSELVLFGADHPTTNGSVRIRYGQGQAPGVQGDVRINKWGALSIGPTNVSPNYGTTGQVLKSRGANLPPVWDNASSVTGNILGFWHVQPPETPAALWLIDHSGTMLSQRRSVTIYDESYEQIIPQSVKSISTSVVSIEFAEPMAGFAFILLYPETTTP